MKALRRLGDSWSSMTWGAQLRVVAYVVSAVVGAVLTARFNAQFSNERGGFDVTQYVEDGFVNGASSSFTVDLAIAAGAALVFMATEGRRLQMRSTIPVMALTFVLAIAFSFPLFLALREFKIARRLDDQRSVSVVG